MEWVRCDVMTESLVPVQGVQWPKRVNCVPGAEALTLKKTLVYSMQVLRAQRRCAAGGGLAGAPHAQTRAAHIQPLFVHPSLTRRPRMVRRRTPSCRGRTCCLNRCAS